MIQLHCYSYIIFHMLVFAVSYYIHIINQPTFHASSPTIPAWTHGLSFSMFFLRLGIGGAEVLAMGLSRWSFHIPRRVDVN